MFTKDVSSLMLLHNKNIPTGFYCKRTPIAHFHTTTTLHTLSQPSTCSTYAKSTAFSLHQNTKTALFPTIRSHMCSAQNPSNIAHLQQPPLNTSTHTHKHTHNISHLCAERAHISLIRALQCASVPSDAGVHKYSLALSLTGRTCHMVAVYGVV